jgi:hypothetical protein
VLKAQKHSIPFPSGKQRLPQLASWARNLTKTLESGSDNFKVVNKGSHFRIFTWLRNSRAARRDPSLAAGCAVARATVAIAREHIDHLALL